jgi:quinol monooxygenase YgiN
MNIRLVAQLSVPADKRDRFKAFVERIMNAVRKDEARGTLVFEYHTATPDGLTYLVHEVYADADAYIAHGKNMSTVAVGIMDLCRVDWAVLSGALPEEAAAQIKAAGGPITYYGHTFANI